MMLQAADVVMPGIAIAISAIVFSHIHGFIRFGNEGVRIFAVNGKDTDADTDSQLVG